MNKLTKIFVLSLAVYSLTVVSVSAVIFSNGSSSNTVVGPLNANEVNVTDLNLAAGTTTVAPLTFTAGTNLATPVNGALEFDGTDLFITVAGTRRPIIQSGTDENITSSNADINGGTIDGTTIGGTTPAAGSFTTLNASGGIMGSGSGITNINATNIASGTLADGRLSSNVPLRDASNTFTGASNDFQNNVILGSDATDTLTVNGTLQGGTPLTFEGPTADGDEINFVFQDPAVAGDVNITFPDTSGTLALVSELHDAVTIVDTASVDLALAGQQITATVLPGGVAHQSLSGAGTNTHAQIDTHIADATIHFTEAAIDHGSITGLADDDHSQYALLAGRGANQTLIGGAATTNTLSLQANSAADETGTIEVINTPATVFNPFGTDPGETAEIRFEELAATGSNYVGFKAADALGGNQIWTLPVADGANGEVLRTNGSGVLSFASVATTDGQWAQSGNTLSPLGGATENVLIGGTGVTPEKLTVIGNFSATSGVHNIQGGAGVLTAALSVVNTTTAELEPVLTLRHNDADEITVLHFDDTDDYYIGIDDSTLGGGSGDLQFSSFSEGFAVDPAITITPSNEVIINEGEADNDFTIRGDTNDFESDRLFVADGADNQIGIGVLAPTSKLHVAARQDNNSNFNYDGLLTLERLTTTDGGDGSSDPEERTDVHFDLDSTVTLATNAGTIADQRVVRVDAPTYETSGSAVIMTKASTLYISNEPQEGANITIDDGLAIDIEAGDMAIESGQLAIGKLRPTVPLDVVGAGTFTGTVTANLFSGSGASLTNIDHGGLGGLADDDHSQYALLAGRGANQTLIGGAATTNTLSLQANSAADETGTIEVINTPATVFNPFGIDPGETSEIRFEELAATGSNYVGFKAADALGGNQIWTLPVADGANGEVLQTNGSGQLSFTAVSSSGDFSNNGENATANRTLGNDDAFDLGFETADTTRLHIEGQAGGTQGFVGIGNTSPATALDVTGTITSTGLDVNGTSVLRTVLPETDDTYDLGSSGSRWANLYVGPDTIFIGTAAAQASIAFDDTLDQLVIDGDGNSLTTTDEIRITQTGAVSLDQGISVSGSITGSSSAQLDGGVVINEPGADVDFRVEGDGDENLLIADASALTATGAIGIGVAAPSAKLEVQGNFVQPANFEQNEDAIAVGIFRNTNTVSSSSYEKTIELVRDGDITASYYETAGAINFSSLNDASEVVGFGWIGGYTYDKTDGAEDGSIMISAKSGGFFLDIAEFAASGVEMYQQLNVYEDAYVGDSLLVGDDLSVLENVSFIGAPSEYSFTVDSQIFLEGPIRSRGFGGDDALVFEGDTFDDITTTFNITDPQQNNTIIFPDASGTVAFTSDIVGSGWTDNGTTVNLTTFTDNVHIGPGASPDKLQVSVDSGDGGITIRNDAAVGDAILHYVFGGVSQFLVGVDDSTANDDFVISDGFGAGTLGTNNRFVIDGSIGNITMPRSVFIGEDSGAFALGVGTSGPSAKLHLRATNVGTASTQEAMRIEVINTGAPTTDNFGARQTFYLGRGTPNDSEFAGAIDVDWIDEDDPDSRMEFFTVSNGVENLAWYFDQNGNMVPGGTTRTIGLSGDRFESIFMDGTLSQLGNSSFGNAGGGDTVVFHATVSSDFNPTNNSSNDLGSDTNRWRDLYLGSNTIHIGPLSGSANDDEVQLSYDDTSDEFEINMDGNPGIEYVFSETGGLTLAGALTAGAVTYPAVDGTNGQVLQTNGAGVLSFAPAPTPSGVVLVDGNTEGAVLTLGTEDNFGLNFETNATTRLSLDTSGHLVPAVDDAQDLGSSSARFRDLYLGPTSLHVGVAGADESIISYDGTGANDEINFSFNDVADAMTINDAGTVTASAFVGDGSGLTGVAGAFTNNSGVNSSTSDVANDDLAIGGTNLAGSDIYFNSDGSAVFNQQGANADFRIEGDTEENLIFVDASTDRVGIGTDTPSNDFQVIGGISASTLNAGASGDDVPTVILTSGTGIGAIAGLNDTLSLIVNDTAYMTLNDGSGEIDIFDNTRIVGNLGVTGTMGAGVGATVNDPTVLVTSTTGLGGIDGSNDTLALIVDNTAMMTLNSSSANIDINDHTAVNGNLNVTGTFTSQGTTNLGDANTDAINMTGVIQGTTQAMRFEGGANAGDILFSMPNPVSDITITYPGVTGTLATLDDLAGAGGDSDWTVVSSTNLVADSSITGNVGIGMATVPESKFEVEVSSTSVSPTVKIDQASTGDASILFEVAASPVAGEQFMMGIDNSSNTFNISQSATDLATNSRFSINSTGQVGIGVVADTQLDVGGDIELTGVVNSSFGTNAAPSLSFSGDEDTGVYRSGINQLSFATQANERMRITSAGQVQALNGLDVTGSITGDTFLNEAGSAATPSYSFQGDTDTGIYNSGTNEIGFSTFGTERATISSNGMIVNESGDNFDVRIEGDGDANLFVADASALTNVGAIGIGVAAPSTKLEVAGTVTATAFAGDGSALTNVANSSGWTDSGTTVELSTPTDSVAIGTNFAGGAPLAVYREAAAPANLDLLQLRLFNTGGAGLTGMGPRLSFRGEAAEGVNDEMAFVDAEWNGNGTNNSSSIVLSTKQFGTMREGVRVEGNTVNEYLHPSVVIGDASGNVNDTPLEVGALLFNTASGSQPHDVLGLRVARSGAAAAVGFGARERVEIDNGSQNYALATAVDHTLTTVTDGSEDAEIEFNVAIGGFLTPIVNVNGSGLVPETDDSRDLGTSVLRWRDLYLGPNSLHIGTDGDEGILSYGTVGDQFQFDPDPEAADGNEVTISAAGTVTATAFAGDGSSLTNLDAAGIGTGILAPANGGTGVNNSTRTLTVNTNNVTLNANAAGSSVTLPASGTLATINLAETFTGSKTFNATTNFPSGVWASDGDVGIGVASPSSGRRLHVSNSSADTEVEIESSGANGASIIFNASSNFTMGSDLGRFKLTGSSAIETGTPILNIFDNGRIALNAADGDFGGNDPDLLLQPASSPVGDYRIDMEVPNASTDINVRMSNNGGSGFTQGLETASNTYRMTTSTSFGSSDFLVINGSGDFTVGPSVNGIQGAADWTFNETQANEARLRLEASGSGDQDAVMEYRASSLDIYTIGIDDSETGDPLTISTGSTLGANVRMAINESGQVGFGTLPSTSFHVANAARFDSSVTLGDATTDSLIFTGRLNSDIVPSSNNSRDLGTDDLRWQDVYVSNSTIHLGPAGGQAGSDEVTLIYDDLNDDFEINMAGNGGVEYTFSETGTLTASTFSGAHTGDGSGLTGVETDDIWEISSNIMSNTGTASSIANNDFVFGSSSTEDGVANGDTRMFFDKSKGAFRAGTAAGTQWDDGLRGTNSAAFGSNSIARETGSFAIGGATVGVGGNSAFAGAFSTASGSQSFAFGQAASATGTQSFAFGPTVTATANQTIAMGVRADATSAFAVAIGQDIEATAGGAFVIGNGFGLSNPLINNTADSLMVGFNSDTPTLFVEGGTGLGTSGDVGIGSTNPASKLDVAGTITGTGLDVNGNADVSGTLTIGSTLTADSFASSCPAGFIAVTGGSTVTRMLGCIQSAENGNDGWQNANDACFDTFGGRLPSANEWTIAIENFALTAEEDDFEWTADTFRDGLPGTSNLATGITSSSGVVSFSSNTILTSLAYRCWLEN